MWQPTSWKSGQGWSWNTDYCDEKIFLLLELKNRFADVKMANSEFCILSLSFWQVI